MVNRWYISDYHWWHENIIVYGKRPFANLKEMHEALVTYHNELVRNNDHVSFLGDLTMFRGGRRAQELIRNELDKYNGHFRLYLGNHDHLPVIFYREAGFEKIYATWRSEEGFISSHIPLHPQSLTAATANVHGHIHQAQAYPAVVIPEWKKNNGKIMPAKVVPYINVSVEAVNYRPIHLDEILQRIRLANENVKQAVKRSTHLSVGSDIPGGGAA